MIDIYEETQVNNGLPSFHCSDYPAQGLQQIFHRHANMPMSKITRLANLRVGQLLEIGNGAIFGSINDNNNDNIYVTSENGAKISSISHSNGTILVGQLHESQAKWVRVGKPVW